MGGLPDGIRCHQCYNMKKASRSLQALKQKFFVFLLISIAAYLLMRWLAPGLGSSRIVEFEIAKTVERVRFLLGSWGAASKPVLLRSIYIDFLFLIGYAGTCYYGCRYLGQLSGHRIFGKAGYFFAVLALIAAACDLFENAGMLHTLLFTPNRWVVHFTYDMAVIKFSLLFIVLVYMFIGLLFWILRKK